MKYIKEIQCVSCPSIPPFSFAHLATNQRRSNEFTFRFAHATISSWWTKMVSFGRGKKSVIHRETSRIRDTNLQHFPREKIK